MEYPEISTNAMVYVYKERYFTGNAPCFDNGFFSLACCKGAKNGTASMRVNACRAFREKREVWIMAIAGYDIQEKGHNSLTIAEGKYQYGNLIYLAKVSDACTWQKYSELYMDLEHKNRIRKDAIYYLDGERIRWCSNGFHEKKEMMETDCAAKYKQYGTEAEVFKKLEQILLSNDYYVFKAGVNVKEQLQYVKRGWTYAQVEDVNGILKSIKDNDILYRTKSNPFEKAKNTFLGGCKK